MKRAKVVLSIDNKGFRYLHQKNFSHSVNKRKIFNDPVYGFITIPHPRVFDLIEHPWFQRLRRIRQLGLTHMVYPGALHTRFHHALGALHLMTQAIDTIRYKGHEITDEEALASEIAILLHDIGHGPFSHALECCILSNASHEQVSEIMMDQLNDEFNGELTTAISIFRNTYHKKFLHQLVSSQLDMDRLDYLNRDSFYTGVLEGKIGAQRLIKMLDVHDSKLVIEEKGIYSVEKFIIARRLMYWQVYLHKTVLSAEQLLVKILLRAKQLTAQGRNLFATPPFEFFLKNNVDAKQLRTDKSILQKYADLDDYDVYASLKTWCSDADPVLSRLCSGMVNRHIYKIRLHKDEPELSFIEGLQKKAAYHFNVPPADADYFSFSGSISNNAYNPISEPIHLLHRDGTLTELMNSSDQFDIAILSGQVKRYFECYLPELLTV